MVPNGQGRWMKIPTSCEKISEGIQTFTGGEENHSRIPGKKLAAWLRMAFIFCVC